MTQGSGPDVGKCGSCGAALTPEDYNAAACRFCGAAHMHHLRAAEKVAQVQGVMAGMMANMQVYGPAPGQGPFPGGPQAFGPPPGGYPAQQGAAAWQNMQSAFIAQNPMQSAASGIVRTVIVLMVVMFMVIGGAVAFILLRMD